VIRCQDDPVTNKPRYFGWAVNPNTLDSDPVWRICRVVPDGDELIPKDWADGDGDFDNVWDDCASLIYVENRAIPLDPIIVEVPSGLVDGVNDTFTLNGAPSHICLRKNGLWLTPGMGNDYVLVGSTITYAEPPQVGSSHCAEYTL
jgi:hypothetical protein